MLFVLSAWLTVSTISYVGSRNLLMNKTDYIRALEGAFEDLQAEYELTVAALVDQLEDLERTAERRREAVEELTRIQQALQRQLESRERQVEALSRQRDLARENLAGLREDQAEVEQRLAAVLDEKAFLGEQLTVVQERLADVAHQRDASRRVEQGLRWQVARLESQLQGMYQNRATAQLWFKDWVQSSVDSLEQLFIGTGVDLETLVARAAADESGQGGPFQSLEADIAAIKGQPGPAADPITDHIRRLLALQKLASSLPLASPIDHFHVTSYFGKRRDPFTRNWAYHGGIDLGAAPGSEVLATAPGRVTHAGSAGPYGNMVEIDHGMGVTTRYGHLESVMVEAGDEIDFRQPIGVIGNTGRSSGRHLHYEVRVDDQTRNPAKFMEAGRYLIDVFNLKHPHAGAGSSRS